MSPGSINHLETAVYFKRLHFAVYTFTFCDVHAYILLVTLLIAYVPEVSTSLLPDTYR